MRIATGPGPRTESGPATLWKDQTMSSEHSSKLRSTTVSLIAAGMLSTGLVTAYSTSATAQVAPQAATYTADQIVSNAATAAMTMDHHSARKSAEVRLYTKMRTRWDQHMQWTYDTIVAFAAESPGLTPTLNRLLRNQKQLGNLIKPYYGKQAGNQLTKLLTEHIQLAVPVLVAAKAGDTTALNKAVADWYANARELGDFLAAANPAWHKKDTRAMMKEHITQTIGYASDVLTGKYAKAISDYDQAQKHMDEMADMLSAGIIAQFPNKF